MSAYEKAAVLTVRCVKKNSHVSKSPTEIMRDPMSPGVKCVVASLCTPFVSIIPAEYMTHPMAPRQIVMASGFRPTAFRRYPYAMFSLNSSSNLGRVRVCSRSHRVPAA